MKNKRIFLIIIVGCCFFACFYFLNKKYDRFYRIAGIDNEKRQMILTYLNEEEMDYLVENSIDSNRFMKYIELEDFKIQHLSYYELLEKKNRPFLNDSHLLKFTNELITKIEEKTSKNIKNHFTRLVKYDLDELFMQSETFNLNLTNFYNVYKADKAAIKLTDIDLLNAIYSSFELLEFSSQDRTEFMQLWQDVYSLETISRFLEEKIQNPNLELVQYPDSLTAIIGENQTISSYVPEPLSIPYEVSRTSFGMYLRQDAATNLEKLYSASCKAVNDETLLLVGAYQSYDSMVSKYENSDLSIKPGCDEFQLALSVDLSVLNIDYQQFANTKTYGYLKDHAWEYGFIQRYEDNPHVYRFVGENVAKLINEKQMTLEEYEGVSDE